MTPRVPIGDLVDMDHRLYSFERDSKIPRGSFDQRSDRWGDVFAIAICALAAVLFILGVIQ